MNIRNFIILNWSLKNEYILILGYLHIFLSLDDLFSTSFPKLDAARNSDNNAPKMINFSIFLERKLCLN